jgi:hypothetical protein
MANKVTEQLVLNVCEMLRILHMPEVAEEDLPELIFRLGQVSK